MVPPYLGLLPECLLPELQECCVMLGPHLLLLHVLVHHAQHEQLERVLLAPVGAGQRRTLAQVGGHRAGAAHAVAVSPAPQEGGGAERAVVHVAEAGVVSGAWWVWLREQLGDGLLAVALEWKQLLQRYLREQTRIHSMLNKHTYF